MEIANSRACLIADSALFKHQFHTAGVFAIEHHRQFVSTGKQTSGRAKEALLDQLISERMIVAESCRTRPSLPYLRASQPPIRCPITDAIIRPRVHPLESPRQ